MAHQQLAVSPLRISQGRGFFVGPHRVAPGDAGLKPSEIPPHGCPYYCPECPHCRKIKHLLNNNLVNLPLGPEAYYDKARRRAAREEKKARARDNAQARAVQDGAQAQVVQDGAQAQVVQDGAEAQARDNALDEVRDEEDAGAGRDEVEAGRNDEEAQVNEEEVQEVAQIHLVQEVVQEEAHVEVQEDALREEEIQEEARDAGREVIEGAEMGDQVIGEDVEDQLERRRHDNDVNAFLLHAIGGIAGTPAIGANAVEVGSGDHQEAADNSGQLAPLNISENLHTPPSSFRMNVTVPNNTPCGTSMDYEDDYAPTPLIINRVSDDITPPRPKRCHKNCRCCDKDCPCSQNPSNIPVLQARCICKCHKKEAKSSSPAKTKVKSPAAASAATGYDASFNLPGPSSPRRGFCQEMRIYMGNQESFTDNNKRTKSNKKAEVRGKGKKRQRAPEEASSSSERSFKKFAPESVAKALGDVNFKNTSDGSKVPMALRCLGFKRIPQIIEESCGLRRSRRLQNKA